MSYIALYRKWRPAVFDDIVGQEYIVKILKSQVVNQRVAHAYLFSGGRGTGKTTTAKIFSRAVNCLNLKEGNPCNECDICKGILSGSIMDVVEIDAASNNSVDDVRAIRDEVFYTPSVSKYRVYIIDEVHMLSTGAFNALLKILEEPPKHVVFLLATTEPHKLPATVLSRCQRFEFRQISSKDMKERLKAIVQGSEAVIEEESLDLIVRVADGALRDAISMLDQCINSKGTITKEKVTQIIGIPEEQTLYNIAEAISNRDILSCINAIDIMVKDGKDISQFISVLTRFFRDILVYKATGGDENVAALIFSEREGMRNLSSSFQQKELIRIIISLSELEANLKWTSMQRVMAEVEMVRLCKEKDSVEGASLEERIKKIEEAVSQKGLNIENKDAVKSGCASNLKEVSDAVKKKEDKKICKKESSQFKNDNCEEKSFKDWTQIVSELKNSGKIVLYANLIGTKAVKTDEKTISIIFNKSGSEFGKTIISKNENLTVLKDAVKRITGEDLNIKCRIEENEKEGTGQSNADNCSGKVAEIAKKFDIPVKIIDK